MFFNAFMMQFFSEGGYLHISQPPPLLQLCKIPQKNLDLCMEIYGISLLTFMKETNMLSSSEFWDHRCHHGWIELMWRMNHNINKKSFFLF